MLHGHERTLPLLLCFLPIEKRPLTSTLRFRLTPRAAAFLAKKTCLQIFIWHGLCSIALIRPFARPPLTLTVARRRCLCPRGMTAYSRAFNLAERVLLCSRMSDKLRCSCSDLLAKHSSSSCCLSGTNSSKSSASYFLFGRTQVWVRGASQACKSLAFVCAP